MINLLELQSLKKQIEEQRGQTWVFQQQLSRMVVVEGGSHLQLLSHLAYAADSLEQSMMYLDAAVAGLQRAGSIMDEWSEGILRMPLAPFRLQSQDNQVSIVPRPDPLPGDDPLKRV